MLCQAFRWLEIYIALISVLEGKYSVSMGKKQVTQIGNYSLCRDSLWNQNVNLCLKTTPWPSKQILCDEKEIIPYKINLIYDI